MDVHDFILEILVIQQLRKVNESWKCTLVFIFFSFFIFYSDVNWDKKEFWFDKFNFFKIKHNWMCLNGNLLLSFETIIELSCIKWGEFRRYKNKYCTKDHNWVCSLYCCCCQLWPSFSYVLLIGSIPNEEPWHHTFVKLHLKNLQFCYCSTEYSEAFLFVVAQYYNNSI